MLWKQEKKEVYTAYSLVFVPAVDMHIVGHILSSLILQ